MYQWLLKIGVRKSWRAVKASLLEEKAEEGPENSFLQEKLSLVLTIIMFSQIIL